MLTHFFWNFSKLETICKHQQLDPQDYKKALTVISTYFILFWHRFWYCFEYCVSNFRTISVSVLDECLINSIRFLSFLFLFIYRNWCHVLSIPVFWQQWNSRRALHPVIQKDCSCSTVFLPAPPPLSPVSSCLFKKWKECVGSFALSFSGFLCK